MALHGLGQGQKDGLGITGSLWKGGGDVCSETGRGTGRGTRRDCGMLSGDGNLESLPMALMKCEYCHLASRTMANDLLRHKTVDLGIWLSE